MKVILHSPDGNMTVEAEPKSILHAFEVIGQISEFLFPSVCGCCESGKTFPQAKHAQEYTFYQHVCRDCGATFSFGQTKLDGRLFPKLLDRDNNPLPNKGWSIYRGGRQNLGHTEPYVAPEPQVHNQEDVPY
jgi:hypothetical protein